MMGRVKEDHSHSTPVIFRFSVPTTASSFCGVPRHSTGVGACAQIGPGHLNHQLAEAPAGISLATAIVKSAVTFQFFTNASWMAVCASTEIDRARAAKSGDWNFHHKVASGYN